MVYFCILVLSLTASASALAANDTYIGVDYSSVALDLPRVSGNVGMLRGRFGVVVLPESYTRFGFESHMAFGLSKASAERQLATSTESVSLELDKVLALYMRAELFNAGIVGVYGLLGYAAIQTGPALQAVNDKGNLVTTTTTSGTTTTTTVPVNNSDTSSGVSYGLGATFFVGKSISIQVETLQLHASGSEYDFDASSVNVGINVDL